MIVRFLPPDKIKIQMLYLNEAQFAQQVYEGQISPYLHEIKA